MEGLTRLVADSLARHGFDRPLDYRRLHWSRWFRCESLHSLLFVPSRPGVFALAEEIMDLDRPTTVLEADSRKPEAEPRRMLAVTQFFEADDMAFVLDRMISRPNTMQARLASGRYFVRYVVIEDSSQRRTICSALNQWMVSAAEKATGIGSHFASSLELTPATEYVPHANGAQGALFAGAAPNREGHDFSRAGEAASLPALTPERIADREQLERPTISPTAPPITAPQLDSGAATNIHCPSPFPSGF